MKLVVYGLAIACAFFCLACSTGGVSSFQAIDLHQNLDKSVLERYQAETSKVPASGGHMKVIEKTDWRLLGLLAFWNKGTVKAMHDPSSGGWSYMVAKTQGWGPLSILYVSEKHAMFSAEGELQSVMAMDSYLWGHVAMLHDMEWKTGESAWQKHRTMHLIHHLLSIDEVHGKKTFSLFSAPNPLSVGD